MKSNYLIDNYDSFWERDKMQRNSAGHLMGHLEDINKAKLKNAILDLAEDVKRLEKLVINLNNLYS